MPVIRIPASMTVYMLRDNDTKLFYRRQKGYATRWVKWDKAAIWTSKGGPAAAKGTHRNRKMTNLETVSYTLTENVT